MNRPPFMIAQKHPPDPHCLACGGTGEIHDQIYPSYWSACGCAVGDTPDPVTGAPRFAGRQALLFDLGAGVSL